MSRECPARLDGAQLDPAPPRAPAEAPAKPPAGHRRSHRQFTGVFREITGPGPCRLLRRHRPRLFTVNKAPSGPQLPRSPPRPRSAGPVAGHFSGDSPGVHRETTGPDLDPRPAARPPTCVEAGVFHGFQADPRHPPPGSTGRAAGAVTGDSPAVHRALTGPGPRALPDASRAHTSAEGGVLHGFQAIRDTPPTGEAPARPRGISPAIHRRLTGGSPGKTRPEPRPAAPSTRAQEHGAGKL